jgi:predicted metal-dependent hydrolase
MPWLDVGGQWIEVIVRESHRARMLRIVAHADGTVEVVAPPRTPLRAVDRLLARHREWVLRHHSRARVRRLGLQRDDVAWLHGSAVPLPDAPIERWYRARAREAVVEVVAHEASRLGLEYTGISIRDQRTRWGSCSTRAHLAFNWRLVLAPREILEYVVVHELCHLRELNHSKRFYRLLDEARPTWREESAWLREHGEELHDYRITPAPTESQRAVGGS